MAEVENNSNAFQKAVARRALGAVLVGVIAAALAAAYSATLPNLYSARCALLVAPPTIKPEQPGRTNPPQTPASELTYLMAKPLSVADYEVLLVSDEIVEKLRGKLKTLKAESGDKEAKGFEAVRRAMAVKTRILARTSSYVQYQPIIELVYTSTSPARAAEMVNAWAALGVELAAQLSEQGEHGSAEFMALQLETVTEKLEAKEEELEAVRGQWDVETRKERLLAMNTFLSEYEYEGIKIDGEIADTQAQLEKVHEDLAGIPEKFALRKAPPDDAYWLMEGTEVPADSSKVLVSETVNELYLNLRELEVTLQSTLAGLEKKRDVAQQQVENYKGEIATLEKSQAETLRRQTALEREVETYGLQFIRVVQNYEAATLAEAETQPDLKVAYTAAVPQEKVGPHRSLIVLAAGFIGLLVVPLHFAAATSLRLYGKRFDAGLAQGQG